MSAYVKSLTEYYLSALYTSIWALASKSEGASSCGDVSIRSKSIAHVFGVGRSIGEKMVDHFRIS